MARESAAGLVLCLLAGCTGSADIQFVSLHGTEVDPPPTAVWHFSAQECYWWIDEAGEMNVAMQCRKRNPFLGKFGRADLGLSLVLGDPPAGSGRNYRVRQRESRAVFLSPLQNQRLPAHAGIVGVTMRDDGTIRGSFRIWMMPQVEPQLFTFFPQRPGPVLCFGTFQAVNDAARGKNIRDLCEANGWSRPLRKLPPTTATARS